MENREFGNPFFGAEERMEKEKSNGTGTPTPGVFAKEFGIA
jgi:hypothetical protein